MPWNRPAGATPRATLPLQSSGRQTDAPESGSMHELS